MNEDMCILNIAIAEIKPKLADGIICVDKNCAAEWQMHFIFSA